MRLEVTSKQTFTQQTGLALTVEKKPREAGGSNKRWGAMSSGAISCPGALRTFDAIYALTAQRTEVAGKSGSGQYIGRQMAGFCQSTHPPQQKTRRT